MPKKNKEKKKEGRPTKYKDSFPDSLLKHFKPKKTDHGFKEDMKGSPSRWLYRFPTVEGWAAKNKLSIETLNDWCNEKSPRFKPQFSEAYRVCMLYQADLIKQYGVMGLAPTNFAKFLLVANHGMSDKQTLVTEDEEGNQKPLSMNVNIRDNS